jgi:hypothetical protein
LPLELILLKNELFLLINGPKNDISKRHLKRRILTLYLQFIDQITNQKMTFMFWAIKLVKLEIISD